MSIKINNQIIEKNSYDNYDLSIFSAENIQESNYQLISKNKYQNKEKEGFEPSTLMIGTAFLGMDDSMIGSTAEAKTARPIIEYIYPKSMIWVARKIQVRARIETMAKGSKIYIEEGQWTEAEAIYSQKEVKKLQNENPEKEIKVIAEMLLNNFIKNNSKFSK